MKVTNTIPQQRQKQAHTDTAIFAARKEAYNEVWRCWGGMASLSRASLVT